MNNDIEVVNDLDSLRELIEDLIAEKGLSDERFNEVSNNVACELHEQLNTLANKIINEQLKNL